MTTIDSATRIPRSVRLLLRLERAELLELRKNRGVWIPAALLTVGAIVVMYGAVELFHLFNPSRFGPAGGVSNFNDAIFLLGQLAASISAVVVGAAAATQDLSSGTLRDLVSSGRSRVRLLLARASSGLVFLESLMISAYLIAAVLCLLLAQGQPTPGGGLLVKAGLWVCASAAIVYLISFGLGSFTGSRAVTISILIAYLLPVQGLLSHKLSLGQGRIVLLSAAIERLSPLPTPDADDMVSMAVSTSIIVLVLWVGLFTALGLWKTRRRDA